MNDKSKIEENNSGTLQDGTGKETETKETGHQMFLDLGDDLNRLSDSIQSTSVNDAARREDNPISFKRFLRNDLSHCQSTGARPKVYSGNISSLDRESRSPRIVSDYSSALPDFVQDHIVIEQCYSDGLSNGASNTNMLYADSTTVRKGMNSNGINCDESVYKSTDGHTKSFDAGVEAAGNFPLDLPFKCSSQVDTIKCLNHEAGASKSLPDFLADGAVYTHKTEEPLLGTPERECQKLRSELEIIQQEMIELRTHAETLTRELNFARNREHECKQRLEKALKQSNEKAAIAENTVAMLRQEMQLLVNEMNRLKLEKKSLHCKEDSVGGNNNQENIACTQRLARELRNAAGTVEDSLRQLLTGVNNLRTMAAALESMDHYSEKPESFLDLDEETGPAL